MYCKCKNMMPSLTTHVVNYKNCIIIIKNVPCEEVIRLYVSDSVSGLYIYMIHHFDITLRRFGIINDSNLSFIDIPNNKQLGNGLSSSYCFMISPCIMTFIILSESIFLSLHRFITCAVIIIVSSVHSFLKSLISRATFSPTFYKILYHT